MSKIAAKARTANVALVLAVVLLAVATTRSAQAQTFSVLHIFTGQPDGGHPFTGLVQDTAGNLYGTTDSGGAYNFGTVFKLDSNGTESILYSFKGGTDGAFPNADLILDAAGNLYGTTSSGGASGNGTVFKLDSNGTKSMLYGFTGGTDGSSPTCALLLDPAGNLYGCTHFGGAVGSGTVFRLDSTGKEIILHSFTGLDGSGPVGNLVRDAAGNLYGATKQGGDPVTCSGAIFTCGAVFKLDTTGTLTVLHSFTGGADGLTPAAGLVLDAAGNLYGTTPNGGNRGNSQFGNGVVFKLDPSGAETVLRTFSGGTDGANPYAGLVRDAAGNLYGTTSSGGASGNGVVFKLDPSGAETVLHNFTGADGMNPIARLVLDAAGNLYGTTPQGGVSSSSCETTFSGMCGVVFKQAAPPGFSLSASALAPSTVISGASSASTVNVNAAGGFSSTVTLSCAVLPSPALAPKCSISPSSTTPGTPAILTVSTTGSTSALRSGASSGPFYALWLPMIGLVAACSRCRWEKKGKGKIPVVLLAYLLFASFVFGVACSSSSMGSSGTPSGTYTITVTGTSGSSGISPQRTQVVLTVQ